MSLIIWLDGQDGYGAGVEVYDTGDNPQVYYIASIYATRAEYPSVRSLIPHVFATVLPEIDADTVIINSPSKYFRERIHDIKRKAGIYTQAKVIVKHIRKVRGGAPLLAVDAIKRKSTVIERMIEG